MSIAGRVGWRWYAGALALAFALAPFGGAGHEQPRPPVRAAAATLTITDPPGAGPLVGNVAVLRVAVTGVRIAPADASAPGAGAHYHVFVDREPPPPGTAIPKEKGIVHSAEDPIVVPGLAEGMHRLTVVLGDGRHVRVGDASDHVLVAVGGPTLVADAPQSSIEGDPWTIHVRVAGVRLARADGDTTGRKAHMEYLIDGNLPAPGIAISEDADNVVHTELTDVPITGLEAGEHHVWVVLSDGTHRPLVPYVADLVTVTVRK